MQRQCEFLIKKVSSITNRLVSQANNENITSEGWLGGFELVECWSDRDRDCDCLLSWRLVEE